LKLLKKQLSPANALACAALFLALGGSAYAAKTTLSKKSVKKQHIANGAVTTPKLRNGAVTTAKLRNRAVTTAKLRPGAVGSGQLAEGAVRARKLGGGVVTTNKLKDNGVTEQKLAGSAVTNSKLGGDSVSTGKIQSGAVSAEKLNAGLLAQLVKEVSYETKTSALTESEPLKEATAECPGGKVAIGGGAKVIGGTTVALTGSGPTPPNAEGKRIGWSVAAAEMVADGDDWSVEAHVVCAEL